jgi:hypothetical protein
MMLAWSACEPPNGYGVTNCSNLSGKALVALVSAKVAAAVVANEAINRRVVIIASLLLTLTKVAASPPPRLSFHHLVGAGERRHCSRAVS